MLEDFEGWTQFGELDSDIVTELIVKAYGEVELSVAEQIVYACRHRLSDDKPPQPRLRPRTAEELVPIVRNHYGRVLDPNSIMRIVEMAESKIAAHVWHIVNDVLRTHLGLDKSEY